MASRLILLLAAGAAASLTLAACDEAAEPPFLAETSPTLTAEITVTPKPTATVSPADLESFRAFAPRIEAAVVSRDLDSFVDIARISSYVCPDGIDPRCEEVPVGTAIEGIWLGRWRSDAALFTTEGFREVLGNWLGSISDPSLYAVAAIGRGLGDIFGAPSFFAIVTSAERMSQLALVFDFVRVQGDWRLLSVVEAPDFLGDEWLSGDCSECYDIWERWEGAP